MDLVNFHHDYFWINIKIAYLSNPSGNRSSKHRADKGLIISDIRILEATQTQILLGESNERLAKSIHKTYMSDRGYVWVKYAIVGQVLCYWYFLFTSNSHFEVPLSFRCLVSARKWAWLRLTHNGLDLMSKEINGKWYFANNLQSNSHIIVSEI